MIETEKVLGAFALLADLDASEARSAQPLVEMSVAEVTLMLRSGACTDETHDRIAHACAAVAYYKYAVVCALREGSVTVGDVKLTPAAAGTLTVAKQLRDDALGSIADLIDNDGFVFEQVQL